MDAIGEARYAAEFSRWYAEEAVRSDGHLGMARQRELNFAHQKPAGISVLVTPGIIRRQWVLEKSDRRSLQDAQ